jgi:predicted nucleic acid-binding protein
MGKTSNEFIIADTSGLISLVVPTDHNHKVAVEAAEKLWITRKEIIITTAVYVEFLNTLGKRFGHDVALAASHRLPYPFVLLNEPQDIPSSGALEKFAELPESVSFTDCLVMAKADAHRTKEIFGFDRQFADAGYIRLEPSTDWPKH